MFELCSAVICAGQGMLQKFDTVRVQDLHCKSFIFKS